MQVSPGISLSSIDTTKEERCQVIQPEKRSICPFREACEECSYRQHHTDLICHYYRNPWCHRDGNAKNVTLCSAVMGRPGIICQNRSTIWINCHLLCRSPIPGSYPRATVITMDRRLDLGKRTQHCMGL